MWDALLSVDVPENQVMLSEVLTEDKVFTWYRGKPLWTRVAKRDSVYSGKIIRLVCGDSSIIQGGPSARIYQRLEDREWAIPLHHVEVGDTLLRILDYSVKTTPRVTAIINVDMTDGYPLVDLETECHTILLGGFLCRA